MRRFLESTMRQSRAYGFHERFAVFRFANVLYVLRNFLVFRHRLVETLQSTANITKPERKLRLLQNILGTVHVFGVFKH